MAKIEDRIAKLEQQLKEAKAQAQARAQRERALAAKKDRADDTRRKVLIGALMIQLWSEKKGYEGELRKELDGFLSRPDDRALFNLPVRPAQPAQPTKAAPAVKPAPTDAKPAQPVATNPTK